MALVLQEDFDFKTNQAALERAALGFYRISLLANTAIEVNSLMCGDFKDSGYRTDCVFYQLEAIRDLARQFEEVFSTATIAIERVTDMRLDELETAQTQGGELLPEDCGTGVLSGPKGGHRLRPAEAPN